MEQRYEHFFTPLQYLTKVYKCPRLQAREIDEIKRLLVEIKEKQAATRGLVDTFRGADYDLDAVYERARQWRHARDDWSREYTPTPPPIQSSNINGEQIEHFTATRT